MRGDLGRDRHTQTYDQVKDHLATGRRGLVEPVEGAVHRVAGVMVDVDDEVAVEAVETRPLDGGAFQHNGSVEHPYQIGFEVFKEVLERDTGGRVEVQIFENAQLGTEEEASLMVKLGALAASAASASLAVSPPSRVSWLR